jgi:hypothetical protein
MEQNLKQENIIFECPSPYIMPEEYKGQTMKNGGYTKHSPRKWTSKEIEWIQMLKEKGFNTKQISQCIDRDSTQVAIKLKRIGKKENEYNSKHIDDKYFTNDEFLNLIQPDLVLDLFAGANSYYDGKVEELYTNDMNPDFGTYYSEMAEKLVAKLWYEDNSFDLIDIDPFGSAYDCFDMCIKMAKKGLIITFGELGHKRFKRIDFVERYYGIKTMEDFTIQNLVNHVIGIGKRNKKLLVPVFIKEWRNIGRVYFKIEKFKVV